MTASSASLHAEAIAHLRGGRVREGIDSLQKALELNPGSAELHAQLGIALFKCGDFKKADGHLEKAARLAPRNPQIQNDRGTFLYETNRPQEAEKFFRKAVDLNPDYADALVNLGHSLQRQGRIGEAEKPYLSALEIKPGDAGTHYDTGMLYLRLNRPELLDKGRQYLEKSVTLNPQLEQAWAGLARSYEIAADDVGVEKTLERAIHHIPQGLELNILKASLLLRQDKKKEAAELLDRISKQAKSAPFLNPIFLHDLGKAFDEMDQPEKAIRYFQASAEIHRKNFTARNIDKESFPRRIESYKKSLAPATRWKPAPPLGSGKPSPVFIVGFPRSGTTLLDQIFSSHSEIEVTEEKPAAGVAEIKISELTRKPAWEALDSLNDSEIDAARTSYFESMKKAGCKLDPDKVFIDRNPFHLVCAPLLHRLFPDARFILAMRHPCDSVLSSYMQRFVPNSAMLHMLDLNDAAKLYDQCFSAWEAAARILALKVHVLRYENLITDLKHEMDKALTFLGLEWQDSLLAFAETASGRHIMTPSRSQVTRELYTTAQGRWLKYREYMGNAPEILRPWAEKFGYEIG